MIYVEIIEAISSLLFYVSLLLSFLFTIFLIFTLLFYVIHIHCSLCLPCYKVYIPILVLKPKRFSLAFLFLNSIIASLIANIS